MDIEVLQHWWRLVLQPMDIENIGEGYYYNQWILKTLVKVSTTTNG